MGQNVRRKLIESLRETITRIDKDKNPTEMLARLRRILADRIAKLEAEDDPPSN